MNHSRSAALPLPDDAALAVSGALVERLRERIDAGGGFLPFDEFMDAALYEPGLGYYANGLTPFGEQGDFITAPESGKLFGRCLAHSLAGVLEAVGDDAELLEVGAGSGELAAAVLAELERLGRLPRRYAILERSAAMRALQHERLARLPAPLAARVEWLEALPAGLFRGVVFGNEVADALPLRRFRWCAGEVRETGVGRAGERLVERERPADAALTERVRALAADNEWEGDYRSEYCPALAPWVGSLATVLERGLLLLIDYGYGRREYYHPQRSMGTLMCHYRHQAHGDPLWLPGLQDITAYVDFTSVAEAAVAAGLQLQGYSSQARFLLGCGIEQLLAEADAADTRRYLQLSNEVKRLMLPGEMGERFKVIGFSRNLEVEVEGFGSPDLRGRL
ncbi:MAG TPA: SAM-dependent methyltransferase [Gammaproteobacteria bacterium]|nr:SAM-dependent methyltransferase [Gammaproteobacteria bacterium]